MVLTEHTLFLKVCWIPSFLHSLWTKLTKSKLGSCPLSPSILTSMCEIFVACISKLIAAWMEPALATMLPWFNIPFPNCILWYACNQA